MLRSMKVEGSLGRVSATVNGFGILGRVRIAPEMTSDLERLGRLVSRAVNMAQNEAWRRLPPVPNPGPDADFEPPWPPTDADVGGALTESELASWRDEVPGKNEVERRAFIDAAYIVRERVRRDVHMLPNDLAPLLHVVHRRLGCVGLSAIAVRRATGIEDPDWSPRMPALPAPLAMAAPAEGYRSFNR